MRKLYIIAIASFLILGAQHTFAQDMDALMEQETSNVTDYTIATFLGNRVVSGQSVEQLQKHGLDFRISHRFGSFKEGNQELFGLDESNSYFTIDYGLTDRLMIGVGRATDQKLITGNIKAKLLRQSTGAKKMPVTVSLYGAMSATTQKFSNQERNDNVAGRLEYTGQLLIARKFNNLSVQLTPTFVHRNMVETKEEANDLMALGISGRYKITSVFDISAEYFWVNQPSALSGTYYNPLSFAASYQVSHHVFQLILTNAHAISENSVIGRTQNSWSKGDIRIGFNISTVF